jgi:single-stranded-DNA-specific exonuclease
MRKNWKVTSPNKELQDLFAKELNILPLTAQVLINRGVRDLGRASVFMRPDIRNMCDPFLMKGMDVATSRIIRAIDSREKIAVYGDYDVDGTTATALLKLFFAELGVDVLTRIPERLSEGYGLSAGALGELADAGVKLVITTDCGVSNRDEVIFAATRGVDMIITDHHEPPEPLPPAVAILNPRQGDCPFPFKGLAGVGVAFYLATALRQRLRERGAFAGNRKEPNLKRYLDLVTIGTVADMVPLVDDNRLLVKYGMEELRNTARPGIKALKAVAGVRSERLNTETISFQLAPRINAAGRVGKASVALELLTTDDEVRARYLALKLDDENSLRQSIEADIYCQALAMIGEDGGPDRGIVLHGDNWHPGVVGIVASRLSNRFSKPAIMIALDGKVGRGSARGIKNFDMLDGISRCSDLLIKFGGHIAAAGFTISAENIHAFKDKFIKHMNSTLSDADLVPEVELDAVVSLDDVDFRLATEMERLSPFGISNREPLLGAFDACVLHTNVVGTKHLKLLVRHKGDPLKAIAFGLADRHPLRGNLFDIAFRPYIDEWGGDKNVGLKVKDFKEAIA